MSQHESMDDHEDEIDTITLEMMDGSEVECEILDTLEMDGRSYISLLPMGKDEYLIFEYKFGKEPGEVEIINIDDESIYEKIIHAFDDLFSAEDDDLIDGCVSGSCEGCTGCGHVHEE